ncbi:class I SAM-dependent methyltransferase [Candidatus Pacearchaeota archaeon]|nr:class I SAM-dependent methyltransferase [Candidatus Pacearchaeota archaeon]
MSFVVNKINKLCKNLLRYDRKDNIELNYFRKESFKKPRWGYDKQPHNIIYQIIDQKRASYKELLKELVKYKHSFLKIQKDYDKSKPYEPHLDNIWLPGLDSFVLYAILSIYKPCKFIEIGSGNSTKFARRAINDHKLNTVIYSIDPQPRDGIDDICDKIIRKPVEDINIKFFEQLNPGDILFIDNSHRCFMNSDVTTIFIDVLPRLQKGVIVEIHDIFLPNDYPPHWGDRYYSEQYLLAAYLLAEGIRFDILLPNAFINNDPELLKILGPILDDNRWGSANRGGGSFWLIMNKSMFS